MIDAAYIDEALSEDDGTFTALPCLTGKADFVLVYDDGSYAYRDVPPKRCRDAEEWRAVLDAALTEPLNLAELEGFGP